MSHLERLIELANSQHGVLAARQLPEIGIPKDSVYKVLTSKSIEKLYRGIYRVALNPISWHGQALAAVLYCGNKAALSHRSALYNLGLLTGEQLPKHLNQKCDIHVTSNRTVRFESLFSFHRSLSLDPRVGSKIVNGILQVSVERAIIESSIALPEYSLDCAVDNAFRKGLSTPKHLKEALGLLNTAPGRGKIKLQTLLNRYGEKKSQRVESVLESRIEKLLEKFQIAGVKKQFEVNCSNITYRLDFAVPSKKVAIEVDGYMFHRTRSQFDIDRFRQNQLVLRGWKVVRITAKFSDLQIVEVISLALRQ